MKAATSAASSNASSKESKSEIEEIQKKVEDVTSESLQSTQRMVEYCEQAKEAGIKAIGKKENKKKLRKDEELDGLTTMRTTLMRAAENLRGMERCCLFCPNPFKIFGIRDDGLWNESDNGFSLPRRNKAQTQNSAKNGAYIGRYTNDEKEEQMEQNMEVVSTVLTNLKNMAINMESELGIHNEQANLVNNMGEANQLRVKDATRRTRDLAKDT